MTDSEYQAIQDALRAKLQAQHCNYNYYGNRVEGYKDGIRAAMSILHSLHERDKKSAK